MKPDALDCKILSELANKARMTWAELAGQLGISPPAAADRVRKLEEAGIIRGYVTQIDAPRLGYDLAAFIAVTLEHPRDRDGFLAAVQSTPEILECHHIAGDGDYLLKVRCRGTSGLEHLITAQLKELPGVTQTRTTIVLSTVKEAIAVPITDASAL
ncbi:Lrp/AsnC family transcriptional regulator [Leptolyngbya iicbica]|uniref:Lrp/AsnC family transcriptional regulator n=2 Tax=Cyanophyceae TaxID=3028117 RepID=A0A4V2E1T2_9CYAN|nr:Lrp/AsnC family transcriptional regulator [Leptolyngbya sp. LK]RZM75189.1 Lrp/AsnC family transcriptional regulator [Leptolyngbya sp. LK]